MRHEARGADEPGPQLSRQQRRQLARRQSKARTEGGPPALRNSAPQRTQLAAVVQKASQAIQTGAYRTGLELLDQVLGQAPDHAEALALKGNLAYVHGQYDAAIDMFRQSLRAEPRAPYVHFNLGAALLKASRPAEAIEPLQTAIRLSPRLAEAYNALGGGLLSLWRFDEAVHVLRKALRLQCSKAGPRLNLGLACSGAGLLEEAISHFGDALETKSSAPNVYEGIKFPAVVLALSDDAAAKAAWQRVRARLRSAEPGSASPDLLDYVIERHMPEVPADAVARAQAALPPIEQETDTLSAPTVAAPAGPPEGPTRICALLQYGRSATGLIHALIDGHPDVTTLPGVYFKGFFGAGVWPRLRATDAAVVADRFADMYEVLFDARHPKPVPGNPTRLGKSVGLHEGFANMGSDRNTVLGLDKAAFRACLIELLRGRERLTQGDFFRLLHRAFERAQGKPSDQDLIFYHIHNPDPFEFLNFLRHFPDSRLLMMVREPLQSCESWIAQDAQQFGEHGAVASKLAAMLLNFDRPEFRRRDAVGLRLDDLKRRPEASLRALCGWLGIAWHPCLMQPTMQGLAWWGDPSSKSFGLPPFDTTVLERQVGDILGARDQQILGALFAPLRERFGFIGPGTQGAPSRGELEPLWAEPLDCERKLVQSRRLPADRLPAHASYQYLRRVFSARLGTLEAHGTYPDMLKPLAVAP